MKKSAHKKHHTGSAPPPLTLLRPRLDRMIAAGDSHPKDNPAILADLEAASQGIKPDDFLAVLLKACTAAEASIQDRFSEPAGAWLAQSAERSSVLAGLLSQGSLSPSEELLARQWASLVGAPVPIATHKEHFYKAWKVADEWQGAVMILWHTDRMRRQVSGMSFLYDNNPPWEGAIKDIALFPEGRPERVEQRLLSHWKDRGAPPEPIAAAAGKTDVLQHILANREQKIRLPVDLINAHDAFFAYVLTLPDEPQTPAFSPQDFLELCQLEQQPEAIMHFEQSVGRRVRAQDGKEIFILNSD